jgi:AAA+ superfamily predicted ATPase
MKQKTKKNLKQQETLLPFFEGLSDNAFMFGRGDFFDLFEEDAQIVADFLDCSPIQALFFCTILDMSLKTGSAEFREIAEKMELSLLRLATFIDQLDILEKMGLIIKRTTSHNNELNFGKIDYSIPNKIFYAIRSADKSKLQNKPEKEDSITLLEKIITSLDNYAACFIDRYDVHHEVDIWLFQLKNTSFARTCKKYSLQMKDILFMAVLIDEVLGGLKLVSPTDITEKIFDNFRDELDFRQDLIMGRNELEKLGFIEMEEGHFKSEKYVIITDKAMEEFLEKEVSLMKQTNENHKSLIKPEEISQKLLFFNNKEKESLDFLSNLLENGNYIKLQKRLAEEKMPKGLVILFFGSPGTGKTSFAEQLALRTSRALFPVDVSEIKDMYYGSSEKQLRKLFKDYNNAIEHSETIPIMIINEMDALVSKRLEINQSLDQTANALQNILLEEFEKTTGIIIGSTNLLVNLDSAFERRFLFKVKFNKPNPKVRKSIWKSKIKGLSQKNAEYLANKYDYSGGEIENIARKVVLDHVLKNEKVTLNKIENFCLEEKFEAGNRKKIGFI